MSKIYEIEVSSKNLINLFGYGLESDGILFFSGLKRWIEFLTKEMENAALTKQNKSNMKECPKESDTVPDVADSDSFPNIKHLLMIGCVSPMGWLKAERVNSDIRSLTEVP